MRPVGEPRPCINIRRTARYFTQAADRGTKIDHGSQVPVTFHFGAHLRGRTTVGTNYHYQQRVLSMETEQLKLTFVLVLK